MKYENAGAWTILGVLLITIIVLLFLSFSPRPFLSFGDSSNSSSSNSSLWTEVLEGIAYIDGAVGIGTMTPSVNGSFADEALHLYGDYLHGTGLTIINEGANSMMGTELLMRSDHPGVSNAVIMTNTENRNTWGLGNTFKDSSLFQIGYLYDYTQEAWLQEAAVMNEENGIVFVNGRFGHVGIGTNSPTQRLDVDGNIIAEGYHTGKEIGQTAKGKNIVEIRMNSGQLQYKTKTVTFTNGLITDIESISKWKDTKDIAEELTVSSFEFFSTTGENIDFSTAEEWIVFAGGSCCTLTSNILCNDKTNNSFTIEEAGIYSITYGTTGKGVNDHLFLTAVFINDAIVNKTRDLTITSPGEIYKMGSEALLNLKVGDVVDVRIADYTSSGIVTVYKFNALLKKIS